MKFNFINYLFFCSLVFLLYWNGAIKKNYQNLIILLANYAFYLFWDWRFLSLILITSITDYSLGLQIYKANKYAIKKIFLTLSLLINFGILCYFKYFNFFILSFNDLFSSIGINLNLNIVSLLLPIGISFYTFKSASYTIDIFRNKIHPTTNAIAYFTFVGFFPQLAAGPIDRASNLLPQFEKTRLFDLGIASDGMRQILWGLFKKIVIADNLSISVNYIFSNYTKLDGSILFLGGIYFAFQLYADFSGYSDIAIGLAHLLGINSVKNFNFPYFSINFREFWQRWHISLTTWFRDYVFLPVAFYFNKKLKKNHYFNVQTEFWIYIFGIVITWLLVGIWHGAEWTFVFWGLYHALFLILSNVTKNFRSLVYKKLNIKRKSTVIYIWRCLLTFILVMISWVFFRANNIGEAFIYIKQMFSKTLFVFPSQQRSNLFILFIFILIEWMQRNKMHGLEISNLKNFHRKLIYIIISLSILIFGAEKELAFIYSQF